MDSNNDRHEKGFHQTLLNEVIEVVYFSNRNSKKIKEKLNINH